MISTFGAGFIAGFLSALLIAAIANMARKGEDEELAWARRDEQKSRTAELIAENERLNEELDRALLENARLREVDPE